MNSASRLRTSPAGELADASADWVDHGQEWIAIREQLDQLEKKNRVMKWLVVGVIIMAAYLAVRGFAPPSITVGKTLLESNEFKLLDAEGKPRFFLRVYSRVPVLQLIDARGQPRMSLGLRFDDTPFIDLSDGKGRTRASFEMTSEDEPMLRLIDEHGDTTFKLKP